MMRQKLSSWEALGIGIGLASLLGSAPAYAVGQITYSTNIVSTAGSFGTTTPGTHSFSAPFCTSGPACGSIDAMTSTGPAGGGFATATLTISGVTPTTAPHAYMSSADVSTEYAIEVVGTFGTEVPVAIASTITDSATALAGSDVRGGGSITVTNRQGQQLYYKNCSVAFGCSDFASGGDLFPNAQGPVTSGGFSGPTVLLAGYQYDVTLEADTDAEMDGTATASVDPTFTIDPAYASRFSIIGVPSAVATVPEPASWALMLSGFAIVGGNLRLRRATARLLAR